MASKTDATGIRSCNFARPGQQYSGMRAARMNGWTHPEGHVREKAAPAPRRSRSGVGYFRCALAGYFRAERAKRGDHLREDLRICGNNLSAVQKFGFARKIANQSAGLLHEEAPG